ncbi:MAG: hypothetical protein IJS69_03170 [Selenomonadaceae bacterium]|nr:hypothetical protein [Selenomonadaceae bacterium]
MNKFAFFKQNPEYRYALLNYFLDRAFSAIFDKAYPFPPFVIYEMIKQEFGNKFGEYDVLISALCTFINTQQKLFAMNQQQFNQFAAAANKRIAELEAEVKRLQS